DRRGRVRPRPGNRCGGGGGIAHRWLKSRQLTNPKKEALAAAGGTLRGRWTPPPAFHRAIREGFLASPPPTCCHWPMPGSPPTPSLPTLPRTIARCNFEVSG